MAKRIESVQNALVKHWKKLITTRKERDRSEEFIVEGFHLVEEAMKQEGAVLHVMVREDLELPAGLDLSSVQHIEITKAVAAEISETEHPQGIFAHCRQPIPSEEEYAGWKRLLLIDAVQDPGNIGTMIRTADAAGMDAVILGKGCADPFNPKTVRSAQGSHFHIPVVRGDLTEWIGRAKGNGVQVIGTGLDQAKEHYDVQASDAFALLVGNEGAGVAADYLSAADTVVKIPLYGQAESLNVAVATGILLYAFARR
ncbi:putative tRNA/rRNA methyltransferase YsgA [Sporosarcina sp. NCCP-2716]|uniref:TrmH family RNA methyltransferase n=1 Tax=Sporosarcina sp. NCCP-2716 TaxID=2943679 RepID=UPI002040D41F|nr:RNA methyltransferase [Sporosarcina sp. NCCP-2716]GKV68936.1 putative tRNA/rRNA methyltransferase YsgA [Sporosarcina sp. NCCP-2716]